MYGKMTSNQCHDEVGCALRFTQISCQPWCLKCGKSSGSFLTPTICLLCIGTVLKGGKGEPRIGHGYSFINHIYGDNYENSKQTNQNSRRSVILILITVLMGGTYVMENPHNSLLAMHPRYVWLLEQLKKCGVFVPHSMEQVHFYLQNLIRGK